MSNRNAFPGSQQQPSFYQNPLQQPPTMYPSPPTMDPKFPAGFQDFFQHHSPLVTGPQSAMAAAAAAAAAAAGMY